MRTQKASQRMAVNFVVFVLFLVGSFHTGLVSGQSATESSKDVNSGDWHAHIHKEENGTAVFNVSVDAVSLMESFFFIEKIFSRYGNQNILEPKDLEVLVRRLGIVEPKDDHRHKRAVMPKEHTHSSHDKCLSLEEMLSAFHLHTKDKLAAEQFSYLCPALVYQLDLDTCNPGHSHNHEVDMHEVDHDHDHSHDDHGEEGHGGKEKLFDLSRIPGKVWGFSCVAVIIISLVGVLGVAVIPIMQKVFYNHLLQFLVALAIGALSGDALLHLLPHAIMASSEHKHDHGEGDDDSHSQAAWKGLMALAGILFFFVTERLLTIITVIKRNRNSRKQTKRKRCEKFCDIESNKKSVGAKLSHSQGSEDECDRTVMLIHPNKDEIGDYEGHALKSYADTAHDEFLHQCDEEIVVMKSDAKDREDKHDDMQMVPMVEAKEEESNGFGHSHGHSHGAHGHAHAVPNSVAAVAWMVILGDGIHNFSDGLAIGAAFANSIAGGFSTSVAVFCHELPHEIGDFAVLLRAGMSVKQAILYNCLSSLLCFMGMLIGVAIGNIASASLWIFACVGGMFLYIALVDMLPEMSSVDPKKGENPFLHLLFQVIGIVVGSSIMLVIALFEHDIKESLDDITNGL